MSPVKANWIRKIKKYHKWPGIVVSLFTLLFAFSGIILNHRDLISSVDVSRKWMPPGYQYENWNLSGVRSSLQIGNDSLLVYGNIGIWLGKSGLSVFQDCNQGFPNGIDKRKIYSIVKFRDRLVAGTHFGVFSNCRVPFQWVQFQMPKGEERISDLAVKGDSLLILTRNYLYVTTDLEHLQKLTLPPRKGTKPQATLFLTLWELHSGELFGFAGMLFVDLLALVLIFLCVTGLLHFLFPKLICRLKRSKRSFSGTVTAKRWNLKWHNLIGYIFAIFLLVNTTAGMFLRPPLLIPIASTKVGIVPFSDLDTENPWQDKLRRILWDKESCRFLIYTSEGFFLADQHLTEELVPTDSQPIVSIMGCNVLEPLGQSRYLVGSFSGLFVWDRSTATVLDYFTGLPAGSPRGMSRPVGQNMVAGFIHDCKGLTYWIDYNRGAIPTNKTSAFPPMPEKILLRSPISLWNAALEIHTGRIFEHLVGPFYLLYVPLMGLTLLIVLISGFLVWWLAYRKH
ncbi:MAG: PepSY domain-containing protein [Prolixibacteraceae bacterium]|nr:PepSY domain-containing protein [Prolixibacteraceae bacterium]